jgi:hypothetical protein
LHGVFGQQRTIRLHTSERFLVVEQDLGLIDLSVGSFVSAPNADHF